MAFPKKQQFVFKHFTTVFLSVLLTHFMHRLFTWSLVVRCLQNHPHFLTRSSYIPVRYFVRYRRKVFVWGEMYSYSFTSGKTYLDIQTWRIVKWATTWQNQQSDCVPSEDSERKLGSLATHSAHSEDSGLSSLGAHSFCWFCHVVAQMVPISLLCQLRSYNVVQP